MTPRRYHPFVQLVLARFKEFYREPEALFWVYAFPLILAIGLGIAFSQSKPEPPKIDLAKNDHASALAEVLAKHEIPAEILPEAECQQRLRKGRSVLYLVAQADRWDYVYDEARAEAVVARHWVDAVLLRSRAGGPAPPEAKEVLVTDRGQRYIDFLLPGLIGTNLMGGGLFGIGFVLVDMRVRKLFKRFVATPMKPTDFLGALFTARLFFLIPEMLLLLLVGYWLFEVPIYGSIPALIVTVLLGSLAFSGIGLLLGSRTDKLESMSGMVNLVMMPMYILSGVFFSSKRYPEAAQPFIQALPLTQLNDALREIMLEGAGFLEVGWRLAILAVWAAVTLVIALRIFRWR